MKFFASIVFCSSVFPAVDSSICILSSPPFSVSPHLGPFLCSYVFPRIGGGCSHGGASAASNALTSASDPRTTLVIRRDSHPFLSTPSHFFLSHLLSSLPQRNFLLFSSRPPGVCSVCLFLLLLRSFITSALQLFAQSGLMKNYPA